MNISWDVHGVSMVCLCDRYEILNRFLIFLCNFKKNQWDVYGISIDFPYFYGISVGFLWCFDGIALGLLKDFCDHGISMIFLLDFYGVSVGILLDSGFL